VLPDKAGLKAAFLPALLQEFQMRLPQLKGKKIVSIYFGGGTPTKLPPEDYQRLLKAILGSELDIAPDCEITLEANPEDVTLSLMRQFRFLGINRVSLGIQSLIDADLEILGRACSVSRSVQAVHHVDKAGIANLSIDLMYELPRQTLKSWERCLQQISLLPVSHLSLYNLTFEPNTIFFKKKEQLLSQLPLDEERVEMLERAVESLEFMGLKRYEISAFAREGRESRHNVGYWTGRPFLGFGPSAFSYWEGTRFSNCAHFNHYLSFLKQNRFPVDFEEKLDFPHNIQELLALHLRLSKGVDLSRFSRDYGALPSALLNSLHILLQRGWLCQQADVLSLTPSGQLFYDSVAAEII
jgi:oxygen-independent coproporphyrinogen III oxidase